MSFLITLDKWFVAPDGDQYMAIFGEALQLEKGVRIGDVWVNDNNIISMIETDTVRFCDMPAWDYSPSTGLVHYKTPCRIYNATKKQKPELSIIK